MINQLMVVDNGFIVDSHWQLISMKLLSLIVAVNDFISVLVVDIDDMVSWRCAVTGCRPQRIWKSFAPWLMIRTCDCCCFQWIMLDEFWWILMAVYGYFTSDSWWLMIVYVHVMFHKFEAGQEFPRATFILGRMQISKIEDITRHKRTLIIINYQHLSTGLCVYEPPFISIESTW